LKKIGQFCGAVLDLLADARVNASEEFNLNFKSFSRQFVTPHAGDLSIDQDHGRNPSLIAIDAFIELGFQKMIFESMGQQVDIEIGKQVD